MRLKGEGKKSSLFNRSWQLALIMFPYVKPGCLTYMFPNVEWVLERWKIICCLLIVMLYIKGKRLSKIILAISMFEFMMLISTGVNGGNFWRLLVEAGSIISYGMLIELAIYNNARCMLRTMIRTLSVLCAINFLMIFIYPQGMYYGGTGVSTDSFYFLGLDNHFILWILPLLCAYSLYHLSDRDEFVPKMLYVVFFSLAIYVRWSATSVVGITLFILFFVLNELKIQFRSLNIVTYYISNSVFFIVIVILRLQDRLSFLIVDILHKDLTFTGRTLIWDRALYWFLQNPLLGVGVLDVQENFRRIIFGRAHCYYLQILYQAGILGMSCFLIILFLIIRPLKKADNEYAFMMAGTICCFLVIFQDEAYANIVPFYGIVVMAYHVRLLAGNLEVSG